MKRFYKETAVDAGDGGHRVLLDGKLMRTPAKGFSAAYFRRMDISPGISCSAMEISLRPQSARAMSRTLKSGVCVS